VVDEKAALEAELESLSQALFEEVCFPPPITYFISLLLNFCFCRQIKWLLLSVSSAQRRRTSSKRRSSKKKLCGVH
jgi:hypothetical protein